MLHGWPDDARFNQVATGLIQRARGPGRRVRAFGEMVALLWHQGHNRATVRLEYLWNKFREEQEFCLFCAYSRSDCCSWCFGTSPSLIGGSFRSTAFFSSSDRTTPFNVTLPLSVTIFTLCA